jgi:hypothetical protein
MISENVEFLPPSSWSAERKEKKEKNNNNKNNNKKRSKNNKSPKTLFATQIKHCPISSKFDMWVDYDVSNLFLTLKSF